MILYTVIALLVVTAAYQLLLKNQFLYDSIGYRFESFWEYTVGNTDTSDGSTLEREYMREKAIELWLQKPIFGHGLDMFASIGGFGAYSHCNYTELLCNHGIVGLIYYYSFRIYLIVLLIKKKTNSTMRLFFIGVTVGMLIYDYGAVSYLSPMSHFFILLSYLFLNMIQSEKTEPISDKSSSSEQVEYNGILNEKASADKQGVTYGKA